MTRDRSVLEFLLVTDSNELRRVRRVLAEQAPRYGVLVGTVTTLIRLAQERYIVADSHDSGAKFVRALEEQKSAFWAKSKDKDGHLSDTVVDAIRRAFVGVMSETPTEDYLDGWSVCEGLGERVKARLQDFAKLAKRLEGDFPGNLGIIKSILDASASDALTFIRVYRVSGHPRLTRWEKALVQKLNHDAGSGHDDQLELLLAECLTSTPQAESTSTLGILQRHLRKASEIRPALDGVSAQWIRVLDMFAEAETAAGIVQTLRTSSQPPEFAEIGLLVPSDDAYRSAVRSVFDYAGLPLSGLPEVARERDLGREVVFNFLRCQEEFPESMAQAAVLSSPLMPFSPRDGIFLAQQVMEMDGRRIKPSEKIRDAVQTIASLIHVKVDDSKSDLRNEDELDPAARLDALHNLVSPNSVSNDILRPHRKRASTVIKALQKELRLAGNKEKTDWLALSKKVLPQQGFDSVRKKNAKFSLEGISVWDETREHWRCVKHLMVLGFDETRYPGREPVSPVFHEEEWNAIRDVMKIPVQRPSDRWNQKLDRFHRQLNAVRESVTFLQPHRNSDGDIIAPSDSIRYMERLFESDMRLMADLDSQEERSRLRCLAIAEASKVPEPENFASGSTHILLKHSPIESFGANKYVSANKLEHMLVSPFAWTLEELGALPPQQWKPRSATSQVQGVLVHAILAKVFGDWSGGWEDGDDMRSKIENLFEDEFRARYPFLLRPEWWMERERLKMLVRRAVFLLHQTLTEFEAEVVGVETHLMGKWNQIPVQGRPDLMLIVRRTTADNQEAGEEPVRWLIVDYKLSTSKRWAERMACGYELQLSAYRALLNGANRIWQSLNLQSPEAIDIVYFTMRDNAFVSDSPIEEFATIPHWQRVDVEDVSLQAKNEIYAIWQELLKGRVRLNHATDKDELQKTMKIIPYALDFSPLVCLFVTCSTDGEAQKRTS